MIATLPHPDPSETVQETAAQQQAGSSSSANLIVQSLPTKSSNSEKRKTEWRTGRWSLDEKLLFLYGLKKFGKGKWKKISVYLPNRSLVQIKSHAQKVLKRYENGTENVFSRLDEHSQRVQELLAHCSMHSNRGDDSSSLVLPELSSLTRRPNLRFVKEQQQQQQQQLDTRQHIIAASALCQLAGPSSTTHKTSAEAAATTTSLTTTTNSNWDKSEPVSASTSGASTPTYHLVHDPMAAAIP